MSGVTRVPGVLIVIVIMHNIILSNFKYFPPVPNARLNDVVGQGTFRWANFSSL